MFGYPSRKELKEAVYKLGKSYDDARDELIKYREELDKEWKKQLDVFNSIVSNYKIEVQQIHSEQIDKLFEEFKKIRIHNREFKAEEKKFKEHMRKSYTSFYEKALEDKEEINRRLQIYCNSLIHENFQNIKKNLMDSLFFEMNDPINRLMNEKMKRLIKENKGE
jgi:uncharacterized membrane-anchored protein YhcB (DUF1043 family)